MTGRRAYLDHAATSPMPEEVLAAYADALRAPGNPALHVMSRCAPLLEHSGS